MDCGKTRYPDKKTARTAANFRLHRHGDSDRRKNNTRRGKVKELRAYACPDCAGWHLSSRVDVVPFHLRRKPRLASAALIHRYD